MLEIHGYDVLTATDGPRGIELARDHSVDLVVLDYDMPGMKGDNVAEVLKRENPTLPILLLTAFGWEIPETLFQMADGYVQKGQAPTVLLEAIEQALAVRKRGRPIKGLPPKEERQAG